MTRSFRRLRRTTAAIVGVAAGLSVVVSPAAAHTEFDLTDVAPGSVVDLTLFVENESTTAGTTIVQLRFPVPIVIVDLPATGEWTAEPVDGSIGAEAIGVRWTRDSAVPTDDPLLPLTIGPLPATEGRLQFKVSQTYGDGRVDSWIQDWPAGAEEPAMPGPVLDLVTGAPGTIPEPTLEPQPTTTIPTTTSAPTTAPPTIVAPTTVAPTTVAPTSLPASTASADPAETTSAGPTTVGVDDETSSSIPVVVVIGLLVVLVAMAAIFIWRRRNVR